VKRYEGLFILDTAGKEDGVKDTIERISQELTAAGCKIETVQKMDRRPFARVANRKHAAGFYVNFIFTAEPAVMAKLRQRFVHSQDVFRVLFTTAPQPKTAPAPAQA